jgi:hypothetical protein
LSINTGMKHTVEHLRFPEATVETVAKFPQITRPMLITDAMIHSTDIAFDVGDQGMDQGNNLTAFFPEPVTIGT